MRTFNRIAVRLRYPWVLIVMVAVLHGCASDTLYDEPRDVWMTYRDGGSPLGENQYFDASYDIWNGDDDAKRYENYAFSSIISGTRIYGDKDVRRILESSVRQCRHTYAKAFRDGTLRQVDSLQNINTPEKAVFRPQFIVFSIYSKRPPQGARTSAANPDYGTILTVADVFSEDISVEDLSDSAKIMPNPRELRAPILPGKSIRVWKDIRFRVIEEFERELKESGKAESSG